MDNLFHFEIRDVDNGYCRIYYQRPANRTRIYCLQDEGISGKADIRLYVCSGDMEPDFEIKIPEGANFQVPTGESDIEKDIAKFLTEKGIGNV